MFLFTAPHNLPTDQTYLPNPQWEDGESLQLDMSLKKSMNDQTYTYIKKKNERRKFTYEFILTRLKSLEFLAFVETYYDKEIRWLDHKGRLWKGYIETDPITFDSIQIEEITKITIELNGIAL